MKKETIKRQATIETFAKLYAKTESATMCISILDAADSLGILPEVENQIKKNRNKES